MASTPVARLAWANVVLHAAGLVVAIVFLQPGSSPVLASGRAAYIDAHRGSWSAAWGCWALCAMALVALLAALAAQLEGSPRANLARFATLVGTSGAAVDLTADALWASVLRDLAAAGPSPLFLAVERSLAVAGQVVANGLYSVAVLLTTWALTDGRPGSAVGVSGLITFAAGMALAAAGFADAARLLPWTAGLTILSFMAWCLGLVHAKADR